MIHSVILINITNAYRTRTIRALQYSSFIMLNSLTKFVKSIAHLNKKHFMNKKSVRRKLQFSFIYCYMLIFDGPDFITNLFEIDQNIFTHVTMNIDAEGIVYITKKALQLTLPVLYSVDFVQIVELIIFISRSAYRFS